MGYIVYSIFLLLIIIATYRLSKKNSKDILLLGKLSILASLIYVTWRIFFTIPSISIISAVLGLVLVIFELIGIFQSFMMYFLFFSKKQVKLQKDAPFIEKPKIDIFICTYNEPAKI